MALQNSYKRVAGRTNLRRWGQSLVLGVWFLLPNRLWAAPAHYQVELNASADAPECNRPEDFEAMLAHILQDTTLLGESSSRKLVVSIAKTPTNDYKAELVGKEADGRTVWSAEPDIPAQTSCFEALYKSALVAAIHMDEHAAKDEKERPREVVSKKTPDAPLCPVVAQSPEDKPKPARRQFFGGLGTNIGLGFSPATSVGLHAAFGWRPREWLSIDAIVQGTFPHEARLTEPTAARIYSIPSLTVAPCFRFSALGACPFVELGAMVFDLATVTYSRVGAPPLLVIGARGFLDHAFSDSWSLRVDANAGLAAVHPEIEDDTSNLFWSAPVFNFKMNMTLLLWR